MTENQSDDLFMTKLTNYKEKYGVYSIGFSLTGLVISIIIFAPNLLMLFLPPHNVPTAINDAGIVFTILERAGQIGCLVLLVLSKNNFKNRPIDLWLAATMLCIFLYYALWLRYAVTGRDYSLLFSPVIIPIPMAILPVLAFGFISVRGKALWLGIADVIFAIGHIANSYVAYLQIKT